MDSIHPVLWHRLAVYGWLTLVALLTSSMAAAERNLARMGELHASIPTEGWCDTRVDVQVSSERSELLDPSVREFQLLSAGSRTILSLECPEVRTLRLNGVSQGREVGRWLYHSDGRFEALAYSAETPAATLVSQSPDPEPARPLTQREKTEKAQTLLAHLGFDPGPVDGFMGHKTRDAIGRFLRSRGQPVVYAVNDKLLAQLNMAQCGNWAGCDLKDEAQATGENGQGPGQPSSSTVQVADQAASTPLPDALAKVLPTYKGRLIVTGSSAIPDDLVPLTAHEWLGEAGFLLALKQDPALIENEGRAWGYFGLLNSTERARLATAAGVAADKVSGDSFTLYSVKNYLDEFERRALLAKIRREVPALLSARTPRLPLPVLIVCSTSFGEYDFNREIFPMNPACEAMNLGQQGSAQMAGMSLSAPLETTLLPKAISVPVAEARQYKARHLDADRARQYRSHRIGALYAVEAQITGLRNTTQNYSNDDASGFGAERKQHNVQAYQSLSLVYDLAIEGVHLFRSDQVMTEPFKRLEVLAVPSLANVSVKPEGEVYLDHAETLSLLLLAKEQLQLADANVHQWIEARMREDSWKEAGNRHDQLPADPWQPFFSAEYRSKLQFSRAEIPAELKSNFIAWTRARAANMPPRIQVDLRYVGRDALVDSDNRTKPLFLKPDSNQQSHLTRLAQYLKVSDQQLIVPYAWKRAQRLLGLGKAVNVVMVLPAPRSAYTFPALPASEGGNGNLMISLEVEVSDVRLEQSPVASALSLVVIEATPVAATATAFDNANRQRIQVRAATLDVAPATLSFDGEASAGAVSNSESEDTTATGQPPILEERAPDAAKPVARVLTGDSALPFSAEVADLLQLKYLPNSVDLAMLNRMMLSRFGYEQKIDEPVLGGRFFSDLSQPPSPAQLAQRQADFRAWSVERAQHLPDRLTVRLRFENGVAQNEIYGGKNQFHGITCDQARRGRERGEALTEDLDMKLRLCDFLDAAWLRSDAVLWLRNDQFNAAFAANRGAGPRADPCSADAYCRAMRQVLKQDVGETIHYRDLVRVDRLPVLKAEHRKIRSGLALEIELQPTSAKVAEAWPDTTWGQALRKAQPFDQRFGLQLTPRPLEQVEKPANTFIFEAKTLAARLVDSDSGEVRAELELAVPEPLPLALLSPPKPKLSLDILGIELGMSFAEAEKLIRSHMAVGRVLQADRARQATTLAGQLDPYSSGRMFISEDEQEVITLFDEPPAAASTVLAIRRQLRLPPQSINLLSLKSSLEQRYGPAKFSRPVEQFGRNGFEFIWAAYEPSQGCQGLSIQPENIWLEESGAPAMPVSAIGQHQYLAFANYQLRNVSDDAELHELDRHQGLCPLQLGASVTQPVIPTHSSSQERYSRPHQSYDEILTWLYDQRQYAEFYVESRRRRDELLSDAPKEGDEGKSNIVF